MRSRRATSVLFAALLAVPFAGVEATLTAEAAGAAVTTYTDATISGPSGIATGPDGALWFANSSNDSIGRITTNGTVTNYSGHGISGPNAITVGPDGALWFTSAGNNSIGRISTKGAITLHPVGLNSDSITAGPDGNLWFTSSGFPTSYVGRFNTTTGKTTRFTASAVFDPREITVGSDGALWFANYGRGSGSIGRITTAGVISDYREVHPVGIAAGSDGALWFTDNFLCSCETDAIGRITTKGITTTHTDPTVVDPPRGHHCGP